MFQIPFVNASLETPEIDFSAKIEIVKVSLRLLVTWIAYFVLLLFHDDLSILPSIFSSRTLQHHNLSEIEIEVLLLWMVVFVAVPLALLLVITNTITQPKHKTTNWELKDIRVIYFINYYVSIIYTILNIIHSFTELFVAISLSQIFLCILLLILGFKINHESYGLLQIINEIDG